MIGGHRTAIVALLGVCVAAWVIVPARMAAQSRSLAVKTVQEVGPIAPEPPLADGVAPGATAVVDPPVPVVAIRVRVPANGTEGQELTYRILVDNTSQAKAHRVEVRASLPTNARVVKVTPEPDKKEPELHWAFGTLAGGASKEINVVVVPDGKGEVRLTARVAFEHGQSVVTHLNQPELRLKKTGPAQARLGDIIQYQLEVTNTGSAEAAEVIVKDELPDALLFLQGTPTERGNKPLTWELGTIAAGRTQRITYQVKADKSGEWTNNAVVTGRGNLKQTAAHSVTVGEPTLSIMKTGPLQRLVTRPAVFFITVSNPGNVALTGVEISDGLPEEVTLVSASPAAQRVGNVVRWSLGTLPAGGRKTVQLVLRARQAGELVNLATARAERLGPVQSETRTVFVNPTAATIEIDKSGDPLEAGKEGTYTIHVINPTNAPLTNVTLKATGNEQLKLLSSRGPTEGTREADKPIIQFKPLQMIGPGGAAVWTIRVETPNVGEARLSIEMNANGLPAPVTVEDKTTVWPSVAKP
jgi:uncharacterized repeat protein (TIGR01451 family)